MALLFPCSQLENTSQIAPIDKLSIIIGGNILREYLSLVNWAYVGLIVV